MLAMELPPGSLVQTHGYHEPGDGGACRYVVVQSKIHSYDLVGSGRAFRPTISGTIHPRQFGTINNGTALDNLPLQACYDYAADSGVFHIDGQGLVYTIGTVNPYEPVIRGWAHTGAIVRSGRTLTNFTFRTAANATEGTVSCSVEMINDGHSTYFRNCVFDGNRDAIIAAIGSDRNGREDGGLHLVNLFNRPALETPIAVRDFEPTTDVYFEQCHFKDAYSYGVRPEFMDALVKFTDCTWAMHGIAVQMHATHCVVEGGNVSITDPRAGRGPRGDRVLA